MKRILMVDTSVFQFKHDNWKEFVTSMDDKMLTNYYERHETLKILGWYGLAVVFFKVDLRFHSQVNK
jgi:hypothetical protein